VLKSRPVERYIEAPNRTESRGNIQACTCGVLALKGLKDSVHICHICGPATKQDYVSANGMSIIAFGHESLTLSKQKEAREVSYRRGEYKALRGETRMHNQIKPVLPCEPFPFSRRKA